MRKISNKLFEVIKSLIITRKNTFNSGINATSLIYVSSELCSIVDIITLLDEVKYGS
jgi:predicted transcriptional regulator